MNRGARSEPIFRDNSDCALFLDLLDETTVRFGVRVNAYALMGNHFHLMLTTPRGNLAAAMSFLQSRFSRRQNAVHGWDGPIFRARYRNRLVEDERYWRHLLAYLHLNPVAAHLVGRPEDATWTSHRAYLGLDTRPDWLDTAELLELYGGVQHLRDYVAAVQVGRQEGPVGFDEDDLWRSPGTDTLPPAAPRSGARTADQAIADVLAVTGRSADDIAVETRGPGGNPARMLAMWWLQKGAGLGTSAVAARLSVHPSSVSRAIRRVGASSGTEMVRWKQELRALSGG